MLKRLFYALIMTLCISGCTGATAPKIRVAALLKSSTNPFFALMWEGIKSEADRQGMKVDLYWAEKEENFAFQHEFLQTRTKDYDALILAPSNPADAKALLSGWKSAGKRVVVLDEGIPLSEGEQASSYFDSFIATDNAAGGRLVAEYSKSHLKPGDTVVVVGGFDFDKPRTAAFEARISQLVPDLRIVRHLGYFDRNKSKQLVRKQIRKFAAAKVIYCANDHMALGVIEELKLARVQVMPIIVGYDSIRAAQEAILRGDLSASVVQFPARMGQEGVRTLKQLVEGRLVSGTILIPPQLSVLRPSVQTVGLDQYSAVNNGAAHEQQ